MKKRICSIALALILAVSLIPFSLYTAKAEEPASTAPVIEKPVYVTVTDANGTPKAGATVQVLDSDGNVIETVTNAQETFTVFLPKGTYTLRITEAPEGFLPPAEDAMITVDVTEAEEKDDLLAQTEYNGTHPEICTPNDPPVRSNSPQRGWHVGIERYRLIESPEKQVTAWCFNQNYDNPYSVPPTWDPDYDPSEHEYKRLVGTPDLLYMLAQNKSDDITPQELYDHVLSIIYHSAAIQAQYGFDDVLLEFIVGRAIKYYTDPKSFTMFDDDGNNVSPNGTVWGSVVNHARGADQKININEVHPEYREAYYSLINSDDHPDDYYLYIYYPHNWEPNNTDTDQCLMSAFTVEPVRTTLKLREATKIEITKTWADEGDQDGYRPTADEYAAMVKLLADGTDVTETYVSARTVTDNGDDTYTVTFTNLPKMNAADKEIKYTIKEDPVPDQYTADKEEAADGEIITNRHKTETVEIPVEKEWQDGENADGVRPEKITVHLLADGTKVESVEITPDADGNWKHTFKDLPKFKDHGTEIKYTIEEDPVPEYDSENEAGTYKITNKHTFETTQVDGKKTWEDDYDHDAMRPKSITIRLFADGKEVAVKKVTEKDGWTWSFTDLPKKSNGKEIKYTIKEDRVLGYTAKVEGYDVINSYSPPTDDNAHPEIWIALLGVSLLVGIGLLVLEWLNKRTA